LFLFEWKGENTIFMQNRSIQSVTVAVLGFLLSSVLFLPVVHAAGFPLAVPLRSQAQLASIHWQLGQYALSSGDTQGAISELETATTLNPTSLSWKQELVRLYEQTGLYYPAIKVLRDMSAIKPTEATFWYERGLLFEKLNQLELAIENLQKATVLDPAQGAYFYDLGVYTSRLGQHEASAKASLRAIELNFNVAEAYNNYGYALSHIGQFVLAEKAINEALKLQPQALAATMDSKGYICHQQNRYKEALLWYARALEKDPLLSEVYLHKAETLEAMGRLPEAIAGYQAYVKLTKPNDELAGIVQHLRLLKERVANQPTKNTGSPVSFNP
jgi:tetratricopeptide (TPR) repeat protein